MTGLSENHDSLSSITSRESTTAWSPSSLHHANGKPGVEQRVFTAFILDRTALKERVQKLEQLCQEKNIAIQSEFNSRAWDQPNQLLSITIPHTGLLHPKHTL
jgi:hypothetical protein